MATKSYVCNKYPSLGLGRVDIGKGERIRVKFENGCLDTNHGAVQRLIEGHEWFGLFIHHRTLAGYSAAASGGPEQPVAAAAEVPPATEEERGAAKRELEHRLGRLTQEKLVKEAAKLGLEVPSDTPRLYLFRQLVDEEMERRFPNQNTKTYQENIKPAVSVEFNEAQREVLEISEDLAEEV
jgi:hypothetical protein